MLQEMWICSQLPNLLEFSPAKGIRTLYTVVEVDKFIDLYQECFNKKVFESFWQAWMQYSKTSSGNLNILLATDKCSNLFLPWILQREKKLKLLNVQKMWFLLKNTQAVKKVCGKIYLNNEGLWYFLCWQTLIPYVA